MPWLRGDAALAWRRAAFWLAVGVVVLLSLSPVEHLPDQAMRLWDKAQHAFGFAGLTVLGCWAYPTRRVGVPAGLVVLGVAIEWAQAWTGWRHGDGLDMVANAVGIAAGLVSAEAIRRVWVSRAARRQTP